MKKAKKLSGTFTVEAAFVVPVIILIIAMGIQLTIALHENVSKEAQKQPAVVQQQPVEHMYEIYNLNESVIGEN